MMIMAASDDEMMPSKSVVTVKLTFSSTLTLLTVEHKSRESQREDRGGPPAVSLTGGPSRAS